LARREPFANGGCLFEGHFAFEVETPELRFLEEVVHAVLEEAYLVHDVLDVELLPDFFPRVVHVPHPFPVRRHIEQS
jgi:hypothetical protein